MRFTYYRNEEQTRIKTRKPDDVLWYKPEISEGAITILLFPTSTFVFKNVEEGKSFFEVAMEHRQNNQGEETGLIYNRINN